MTTDTLPWDEVSSDSEDIPFDALQRIADAMPQDPAVLDRLYDSYVTAQERHWREGGFEFVYIPGIIALGAEKLSGDLLKEAIMVVLDWLDETPQGADLDFEILQYTLHAIGPAVLPYVVKRLRERNPTDSQCFHLRGLLEQLAKTDDPALRGPAVEYCRETIDAAVMARADADLVVEQARALIAGSEPDLRGTVETLRDICLEHKFGYLSVGEFGPMLQVLDGEADFETALGGAERETVRAWITRYHDMIREWRLRPPDADEMANLLPGLLDSPLPKFDDDYIQPIVRDQPRVGRNDPCLCGSGKKYKKCCGR